MAPRTTSVLFAVLAIAIAMILVLFVYPGYLSGRSECPLRPLVDGRFYCAESITVVPPPQCQSGAECSVCPPSTVVFQGVVFQLSVEGTSEYSELRGCVTESNSTAYEVQIPGESLLKPSVNWTSPDHEILVAWQTPYGTVGSDGQFTANVTCGVLYAMGAGS
jgi:hypothetical protein